MINIFEIERQGVRLKALNRDGNKNCKSSRKKTSLYTTVSIKVVVLECKVGVTDKDKDCVTLSFPPFSGLPMIFI